MRRVRGRGRDLRRRIRGNDQRGIEDLEILDVFGPLVRTRNGEEMDVHKRTGRGVPNIEI